MVTSLLAYLPKAVPAQHPNDLFGTANRKAIAHLSATSSTFAPAGNVTGAGSNQRSSASLAFRTASSSVSPAEAHPGNSGKNAAQRLVWGSCSTTSRSFMGERITSRGFAGKPQMSDEPFVFIRVDSWLTSCAGLSDSAARLRRLQALVRPPPRGPLSLGRRQRTNRDIVSVGIPK